MELRHLRYFLAIAEEQNFTRAAHRLHVSVPPLSRQIRDLERELGVVLLVRNTRSVRLTEAGRIFQVEAAATLQRANDAVESVRALAQHHRSRVRVGYAASPTLEILPRALHQFHRAQPHARVELHELSTQAMVQGLRERSLDVALVVSISRRDFAGLSVEEIASYAVHVAMPPKHSFARRQRVRLRDLADEPLVTFSREGYPEAHQGLKKILGPYTRAPRVVAEYDTILSLIAGVEAGGGVALLFETAGLMAGARLVLRPLEPEPPPLPISVVHHPNASSTALSFADAVKSVSPMAMARRHSSLVLP